MDFLKRINFEKSWSRFPLSTCAAICIGVLLIYLNQLDPMNLSSADNYKLGQHLVYTFMILFFTSLFVSFWSFKNNVSAVWRYSIPIGFSILYFFCLPQFLTEFSFLKHLSLILFFVLLLVPWLYPKKNDENSFWSFFVYHLVLLVETTAFSLFVFGSISIAIFALEQLFNISFKGFEIYLNLFILVASIFHPIYFLSRARLPKDSFPNYNENKVLQIFASKILLPVVFLYALILSAYFLKILIQGEWPRGWISNLILWFSAFSIPGFFLNNYLFAKDHKPRYVSLFEKLIFYFLALCAIVLAMAVQIRVADYGVTESRYLLIVLAFWLLSISLYFIFSKKKSLTILPISLAAMLLFTIFGPYSLFEVPVQSQFNRLKRNLASMDLKDKSQIAQIAEQLRFLDDRNALDLVFNVPDFSQIKPDVHNIQTRTPETLFFYGFNQVHKNNPIAINAICETLGFDYKEAYSVAKRVDSKHFNFFSDKSTPMDISDYDHFLVLNNHMGNNQGNANQVSLSEQGDLLIIDYLDRFSIPVEQIFDPNNNIYTADRSMPPYSYEYRKGQYLYYFIFQGYSGVFENDKMQINHFSGYLFIKDSTID